MPSRLEHATVTLDPTVGLASRPVGAPFFARATVEVARDLLGKLIVSELGDGTRVARIVEVEAYLGERDQASHARRGKTPRASIMFGPPGHLYVYLVYGMHHCMNVVTEADGTAGAVLLRAAEPLLGFDAGPAPAAERGRGGQRTPRAARLLAGPGKLCAGFGITRLQNGLDLSAGPIAIHEALEDDDLGAAGTRTRTQTRARTRRGPFAVKRSPRIGVAYAGAGWAERPLRFYLAGHPHVSGAPR